MVDTQKWRDYMYDIVGAIYEVGHELGPGLNESCYQEGLERELLESGIPFDREASFHPMYHGKPMDAIFRIDFLCKENVVIECKSVAELTGNHRSQLFNYMHLLKKPCGILVNFAPKHTVIERYLYDKATDEIVTMDGNAIKRQ